MSCLLQTSSSSTPSCDIAEPYPSISTLCQVLKLILQETDEKNKGFFTCFDAVKVPTITLRDFLVRIMKFSNCSDDEILVLALIYIDRIGKKREGFMMNSQKIHRLFIFLFH